MKFSIFILCLFFFTSAIKCEAEDPNIIELTDDNFDAVLAANKNLLIEFYSTGCKHCREFEPEYSRAAEFLVKGNENNEPLKVARIDGPANRKTLKNFDIDGFPTVKLYKKGEFIDYDGPRSAMEIIYWARKKVSPPVKVVKSLEDLGKIAKEVDALVVYFGDNSLPAFQIFNSIAEKLEEVFFVHVAAPDISEHVVDYSIVIIKHFDEKKNVYEGALNEEELKAFIEVNTVPIVSNFDDKIAEYVFGRNKTVLILFRNKDIADQVQLEEEFKKVAPKFKGKVHFSITDIKDEIQHRLAEYYGIVEKDLPQVRITEVKSDEDVVNFLLLDTINEVNIEQFVQDYLNNNLKPFLRSEEIPEVQNEEVYKVVGKSFHDIVIHTDQHVVIMLYAPWCKHSKAFAPDYNKVSTYYGEKDDILITKMDASANEIEGLEVKSYPTILIYLSNDKANPIEFTGQSRFSDLVKFIDLTVYGIKSDEDENEEPIYEDFSEKEEL